MPQAVRRLAPDAARAAAGRGAEALLAADRPLVLEGLARDWPLVAAGRESPAHAADYLKSFDAGKPIVAYTGAPEIGGRFFYDDRLAGMNFQAARERLPAYLDRILVHLDEPRPPAFYVGSTDLDTYLPGLRDANPLPLDDAALRAFSPSVGIWIGNRTIAATHYDMSNNIAVCSVGRRRFTLFPPDQVGNLYPGPLEPTPGGQVVSMVDLRAPDLARYPRFADALDAGQIAELEPGDVLVYPALWWHNVEALDRFNVLVNYWWNPSPRHLDTPMNALLMGLLSLRDRPAAEKRSWRAMFDFYVFGDPERPAEHLPEAARGPLGPIDPLQARRIRATLLNRLNR